MDRALRRRGDSCSAREGYGPLHHRVFGELLSHAAHRACAAAHGVAGLRSAPPGCSRETDEQQRCPHRDDPAPLVKLELNAAAARLIIEAAVRRMVPRNRLGRQQMTKLKIYAGPSHPHQAQQPVEFKLPS